MLTCKELTEHVTEYLEGRMSFSRWAQFQMHLSMCRHCRAYLRQTKMTLGVLGKLPGEPVPPQMRDALVARLLDANLRTHGPAGRSPTWTERVLVARRGAALLALAVFSLLVAVFATVSDGGPLGAGVPCLITELGFAAGLLSLGGVMVVRGQVSVPAGAWVVLGVLGSLIGFGIRQVMCSMANFVPHFLIFHVGGVILAALLGASVSRLATLR